MTETKITMLTIKEAAEAGDKTAKGAIDKANLLRFLSSTE